jgi:hypothetical protein
MQERISRLEGHYEQLSTRMSGMEHKMDKVLNILSDQKAKQLPPIQTILATAAIAAGLVGSLIGGFFFLVDARVGAAVSTSNQFVAQMTDHGGVWVRLATVENRLTTIERDVNQAIRWRPVFTAESADRR